MNLFQKRQRYYHIWNNSVTLLLVVLLQHKFTFRFIFQNFSPTDNTLFYNQHNAIYRLQQRNTVDFGLYSWFSSFERKGSRWKPYNQLPGNSVGSLVFVAVPKTRIFEQSLASSSHYSQPTGNTWNARRSTLQCWSTRYRHEWIRAIRFRRYWIQLGRSCSGYGQCLSTWNRYPLFPIHLWRFSDAGINRYQANKSWRWGRQGEFSSNNNHTRVWASNRTSEITEKSSIRDSTRKCAWLRIQDSVSLNFVFDTLYVFCVYK